MSCRIISILEFDRTIPVSPPTVNRKINPKDQSMGASNLIIDFLIVVIHLKMLRRLS